MNLKRAFKLASFTAGIGIVAAGCNQFSEFAYPTREEIRNGVSGMISDFHHSLHPSSRATDDIEIIGIETRTYCQGDFTGARPEVRSDLKEYEIHTVTLKIGDTPGYAILSDTPGIERIFYYTESGCISDTALIPPLKEIVETAPKMADLILSDSIHSHRQEMINAVNIDPIVRFQWHQGWPYNFCATNCSCKDCNSYKTPRLKGHRRAGCVPVALAQAIATMKHFRGTFYGNRDIDFDALPSVVKYETDAPPAIELSLGHFLQEIALNCQVQYTCSGTYTDMNAATNYMRDIGYSVDHIKGGLDVKRFINFLQRGNPHIVGGSNGKKGHAWILDGVRTTSNSYQYHINWGFGPNYSPGWSNECYYGFYSNEFLSYHKDTEHMYILAPGS